MGGHFFTTVELLCGMETKIFLPHSTNRTAKKIFQVFSKVPIFQPKLSNVGSLQMRDNGIDHVKIEGFANVVNSGEPMFIQGISVVALSL